MREPMNIVARKILEAWLVRRLTMISMERELRRHDFEVV